MSYDDSVFDGNDDDVFVKPNSSTSESQSGGTFSLNNARVPGYLRDALQRYIRENPQIEESFQNFRDPSSFSHFISIFSLFNHSLQDFRPPRPKSHWAQLRAVLHVLDYQHEGLIQRLTEAYHIEHKLMVLHSNYISVSQLHEAIVNAKAEPTEVSDSMVQYLGSMAEMFKFAITSLNKKYLVACELAEVPPDTQLMEFGLKSEGDYAYATTNSHSQLSVHYKYGDVSFIATTSEDSFRTTFIRFLLPVIFADEKMASGLLHDYAQSVS